MGLSIEHIHTYSLTRRNALHRTRDIVRRRQHLIHTIKDAIEAHLALVATTDALRKKNEELQAMIRPGASDLVEPRGVNATGCLEGEDSELLTRTGRRSRSEELA
jgi:hypothetical protein